jgi:6-phosphofructokinase 2
MENKMKPIVTITMNPSIDESTSINQVVADKKLRCKQPTYEPGGGGINVSRVIKTLGGDTLAMYLAGGPTGQMFQNMLDEIDIVNHPVPIKNLTRMDLMVIEEISGRQYRFGMPGPEVREKEWQQCLADLSALDFKPEYIVASGSLPLGVPDDFYTLVARISHDLGSRLIVDTSGVALCEAIKGGVFLLKPNMNELKSLIGKDLTDESQIEAEVVKLVKSGKSEIIVLSLGAAGALMVSKEGTERVRAPTVPIVSKVGAGDSTVGGIVLGLARGMSIKQAVFFGVAAGSATVMTPGSQLCRREDVERLYNNITKLNSF